MDELLKNSLHSAVCTGYTSKGEGVVRIGGRAVFVKGLIRGERAIVRIVKSGSGAVYGRIEELTEPSEMRREPDCPVFGKCGGCALRHMDYMEELELKTHRVRDALERIGGIDVPMEPIIGADRTEGYRNKTIYTVGWENGRAVTGFYRPRSHDLIPAERCAIESDFSHRAAGAVREWMDTWRVPSFDPERGEGVRRLFCRYGFASGEGQVVIVTGRGAVPHRERLVEMIRDACPGTVSVMRNINANPGDTVLGQKYETLWGGECIHDTLCGLEFSLSPSAFYQVNRDQAERLYDKALEYACLTGREKVLDLYCGTGTITLCMASRAGSAVGVEIVESAVDNARENAAANGVKNARFIAGDAPKAADGLLREGFRPDVVVVDPPRKGLSPETPELIASMEPKRVVYVSCDPGTLARDLARFAGLGYKTTKICPVDMFPRTHHVECCALLSR